jgi:4-amino-4-deoxy-L-arabinose transferase-like glycosyltransferase
LSRTPQIIVGLALIAYAALAIGYATATPVWQNPDEPAHFNYAVHVAQTATLPELRHGDWDSELLERLKNGRLQPGDDIASIRYESWQPPLSYLVAAPALRVATDPSARVLTLRLFNVILGGLTLLVAFLIALQMLPPLLAAAVPVVMAGIPMFTAVSASVSADPLANLLAAAILLALIHPSKNPRWAVATGALLGLGLLTKLALAIFVPIVFLVLLNRSRQLAKDSVVVFGTAALIMLPWLVHQVTTYGWSDPLAMTRHAEVVSDQPRLMSLTPEYAWQFLTTTFHSFWAQFGWMAIPASNTLYWIWGALTIAAVVGLAQARARLAQPAFQVLLATIAAACAALLAYNLTFTQFQGRYLFTALVPVAILCVLGWSAWLPSRLGTLGTLCVAWALVALNVYTFLRVLVPGFAPAS